MAISILLAVALGAIGAKTFADEACVDFKWDVTQERELFAGTATPLSAGADSKNAPVMQLNHLYALKLMPQAEVTFAATPGKKTPSAGSNAGVFTFKLPASGVYTFDLYANMMADGAFGRFELTLTIKYARRTLTRRQTRCRIRRRGEQVLHRSADRFGAQFPVLA